MEALFMAMLEVGILSIPAGAPLTVVLTAALKRLFPSVKADTIALVVAATVSALFVAADVAGKEAVFNSFSDGVLYLFNLLGGWTLATYSQSTVGAWLYNIAQKQGSKLGKPRGE